MVPTTLLVADELEVIQFQPITKDNAVDIIIPGTDMGHIVKDVAYHCSLKVANLGFGLLTTSNELVIFSLNLINRRFIRSCTGGKGFLFLLSHVNLFCYLLCL